jgi:hypothetical protein
MLVQPLGENSSRKSLVQHCTPSSGKEPETARERAGKRVVPILRTREEYVGPKIEPRKLLACCHEFRKCLIRICTEYTKNSAAK